MGGPRPVGAQRRRVRDRADPLGRPSPPPRPHIHTRDSNEAYMPQNSLIYLISIQSNRPGIYPTYRHQKAHYPERDYTDGTTTYKNLECWSRTSRATEANYSEIMCVGTVEFFPLAGCSWSPPPAQTANRGTHAVGSNVVVSRPRPRHTHLRPCARMGPAQQPV